LTNIGVKADVAYNLSNHNVKIGGSLRAAKLNEQFTIGFTDPSFNSPCLDARGRIWSGSWTETEWPSRAASDTAPSDESARTAVRTSKDDTATRMHSVPGACASTKSEGPTEGSTAPLALTAPNNRL
jgi:hypothetical protein